MGGSSSTIRMRGPGVSDMDAPERQIEPGRAALANFAGDDHTASVCFGDVLHDAESDARAGGLAAKLRAAAVEKVEDTRLVFGWDAGAGVLHPEANIVARGYDLERDGGTGRRVLDGVIHQVDQRLFDGSAVPAGLRRIGRRGELERDTALGSERAHDRH